jgi:hypothetical protein
LRVITNNHSIVANFSRRKMAASGSMRATLSARNQNNGVDPKRM